MPLQGWTLPLPSSPPHLSIAAAAERSLLAKQTGAPAQCPGQPRLRGPRDSPGLPDPQKDFWGLVVVRRSIAAAAAGGFGQLRVCGRPSQEARQPSERAGWIAACSRKPACVVWERTSWMASPAPASSIASLLLREQGFFNRCANRPSGRGERLG